MKKLLIITYMFPPTGGIGIQRPLKFVKYLPEFGIMPIVFCPQKIRWRAYDASNLNLSFLRDKKIFRCGVRKLKKYYHLRYRELRQKHIYFWVLALKYLWFMDFMSAWYFECRDEAFKIAQQENVDCLFTTSPPHSVHLFGDFLKKKLGIPWIMDLRDAMFDPPNRNMTNPIMRMSALVEYFYEKHFYLTCDALISVSQPIVDSVLNRHPHLSTKLTYQILPNGFDEEDFGIFPTQSTKRKHLLITYTGSFIGKQTPRYFLDAVSQLAKSNEINPSEIMIRFIGYFDQMTIALINSYCPLLNIEVIEYQPHHKSLEYQVRSDLLLLVVSADENERGQQILTGKVFEYIGAKVPIFALIPNGPLKETILKGRFGVVAPPKDVSEIAKKFNRLYGEWKSNGTFKFDPDTDLRNSFTRRQITGRLAEIIDKIA